MIKVSKILQAKNPSQGVSKPHTATAQKAAKPSTLAATKLGSSRKP